MNELPRAVATIAGDVLGGYYYSHSAIESLFYECGASGDPPLGNCQDKITRWLLRQAEEDKTKSLQILGKVLEEFMDSDLTRNLYEGKAQEQDRVVRILKQYGLEYCTGGRIFGTSVSQPSKSLDEILRERNLPELNQEFERAISSVDSDPPAAVTAACSILESLCKVYIHSPQHTLRLEHCFPDAWPDP